MIRETVMTMLCHTKPVEPRVLGLVVTGGDGPCRGPGSA